MVQLPDVILEEILCRLSVKCLLRFRCVSKSWFAIISSPNFAKLHLNRSVQTKRNLRLFQRNNDLFREKFDSLHDGNVLQKVKVDSIPLTFRNYRLVPRCSCDGLICMLQFRGMQRLYLWNPNSTIRNYGPQPNCFLRDGLIFVRAIENVFLWNPSIKKSIKLPYASIEIATLGIHFVSVYYDYRIGYDNINDDYKVVRIVLIISRSPDIFLDYEVKVYSLGSNSWHKLEKFLYCPDWHSFGNSIAGGAMHWISIVKSDLKSERLIVAFDLGTEKCRVLPKPEYTSPHFKLYLHNLEGCLSLSCQYESSSIVDVFLLKDYGGKNEHWSRLITLSPTTTFKIYHPFIPIAYSKSGKKVWFMNSNRLRRSLVLYNLEQKSVEKIRGGDRRLTSILYNCLESLVPVDVPAAAVCNQVYVKFDLQIETWFS
ncbi:F-box protein CPR1-like [Impatiens glandulifera]|uniref:F-box protein CPR1-like n=1 Tax=Impatiens glandulifera TaxID=253017 RepID=UPI001FB05FB3|nr:F-box protein CPR1-like [Impatiens glandulifera]